MSRIQPRFSISLFLFILTIVFISFFSGSIRMLSGEASSGSLSLQFQNPPPPILS